MSGLGLKIGNVMFYISLRPDWKIDSDTCPNRNWEKIGS